MNIKPNTNILVAALAVTAIITTGCVTPESATKNEASAAPTSSPIDNPPAEPDYTPPAETPAPDIAKVGATEWFTYKEGLKVQVTSLKAFTISENSAGGKPGGSGVIASVKISNGTKAKIDVSLTTLNIAYGPQGDAADEVYDYDRGLGNGFAGSLAPGRAKTAKFGFAVPRKYYNSITVEVQPGFLDYDSAIFEGTVK